MLRCERFIYDINKINNPQNKVWEETKVGPVYEEIQTKKATYI